MKMETTALAVLAWVVMAVFAGFAYGCTMALAPSMMADVIDLDELLADFLVQRDQGFTVLQLHRLLGEILRERLVPVAGVAGNPLLPLREFLPARLQPRSGLLCVHIMLRVHST